MTAACPCWDFPVTLHDGHCCMRGEPGGPVPTCHPDVERAKRAEASR